MNDHDHEQPTLGPIFDPFQQGAIGPPEQALAALDRLPTRRRTEADRDAKEPRRSSRVCPRHLEAAPEYINRRFRCTTCKRRLVDRKRHRTDLAELRDWRKAVEL